MPDLDAHPGVRFERAIGDARVRARAVRIALGVTLGADVCMVLVNAARLGLVRDARAGGHVEWATVGLLDRLAELGDALNAPLLLVTGVLFVRWLRIVVRLAREFGGGLRWKPRQVLWAFLMPIVSLWRPYELVRDVTRALAPERLPEPRPRLDVHESTGYRDGPLVVPPRGLALPNGLVGAWWATWVAGQVLFVVLRPVGDAVDFESRAAFRIALDALDVASAALAIQVVGAVAARLAERFRRIRFNPVDVLRDAGMDLPG
jgi:hypothetical protein